MAKVTYDKQLTALLVIDPYNDFISEGGKVWGRLKAVAEANRCIPHMLQVLNAARKAELRVFYALHRRYRPGDYESWGTSRPFRKRRGRRRSSNTAPGAARSAASSSLNLAISWPSSTGAPVGLRTRIWICTSSGMAFTSSSSWDSSHTPAWRPRFAMRSSLATRSRWSGMRPRAIRTIRCTPLSTSISRTMPAPW
jgi:hypothetical protein